jgi:hypothetical protein
VKRIQVCSNERPGEIIKCKYGVGSFKNLLQNHWANFKKTWHKLSFEGGDSGLFKGRGLPLSKGR